MSQALPTQYPGDDGRSDLLSGLRQAKDSPVFDCLGMLDELNAAIGQLRVALRERHQTRPAGKASGGPDPELRRIQLVLSTIMGFVARSAVTNTEETQLESELSELERQIDRIRAATTIGREFYVPGDGCEASALADVARARCRTAERTVVALGASDHSGQDLPGEAAKSRAPSMRYLNRLSDYLFVLARYLDA